VPMLRAHDGQGANCTFSGRQPAGSAAELPNPGSSKEGGGIPPSASRIAPSRVIKALHFVYDR